jgi:hypothetical protein
MYETGNLLIYSTLPLKNNNNIFLSSRFCCYNKHVFFSRLAAVINQLNRHLHQTYMHVFKLKNVCEKTLIVVSFLE